MIRNNAEEEVKQKYESLGYTVISEPSKERIPFDLGNYIPDFLCQKDDENILIEVKGNIWNDSIDKYKEISKIVNRKKGWKYLVIQLKDSNNNIDNTIYNVNEYNKYINKIEKCLDAELYDAALIFSWNLLKELFYKKYKKDEMLNINTTDKNILNNIYSDGIISINDYDKLNVLLKKRNEAVHNIKSSITRDDVEILMSIIQNYNSKWNNIVNYNFIAKKS